jgi:UDP-N-acetylglucosamine pyrophosphorylase
VSFNRLAPGGHAFFGMNAILDPHLPEHKGQTLISTISNGEDLSAVPDAYMVGWMAKENIPIAMITTEKTENDLKGGQIALVSEGEGKVYATIIEAAQAKENGQLELFEKIGLKIKRKNQVALFNTNAVLINYTVLLPLLNKLRNKVGEDNLSALLCPDLIENWKEQKDLDGVSRRYMQLEGAMASTYLNLDRAWREHFNEPLVRFIVVPKKLRTQFFSPVKTAFDFFMQCYSDRFSFDKDSVKTKNLRPTSLPAVTLVGQYYQDVENVLSAFEGASIKKLDSLTIEGKVSLKKAKLIGNVSIKNKTGNTVSLDGKTLKNTSLVFE